MKNEEIGSGKDSNRDELAAQAMNTIKREESRNRSSLEVSFTDQAMESVGNTLLYLLNGTDSRDVRPRDRGRTTVISDLQTEPKAGDSSDSGQIIDIPSGTISLPDRSNSENVDATTEQIFYSDGETFSLQDPRLKANTRIDFVQRSSILFLHAHLTQGRDKIEKTVLIDFLKKSGVWDPNASKWPNSSSDLLRVEHTIGLNFPGKERAKKLLSDYVDPAVVGSWSFDSRQRPSKRKIQSDDGADNPGTPNTSTKSGRSESNQKARDWAAKWRSNRTDIEDVFSRVSKFSVSEKGLFALWGIDQVAPDVTFVSRDSLSAFLEEALVIKASGRSIESSLQGSAYAIKNGTKFRLNPAGKTYITNKLDLSKP